MEGFKQAGIDGSLLKALNKIRLYLRAFMLSDICDGAGLNITRNAWEAKLLDTDCRGTIAQWPDWKTINKRDIRVWQHALSVAFCTRREQKLDLVLGVWKSASKWQWFICMDTKTLLRKTAEGWFA